MKSSIRNMMFFITESTGKDSSRPLMEDNSDCQDVFNATSTKPDQDQDRDQDQDQEKLQELVRESFSMALQMSRSQTCRSEEDYVHLYVDIIQLITVRTASTGSAVVRDGVWTLCYKELLLFVKRYKQEQTEELNNKAQTWKENRETFETVDFLKTLKTCKEFRRHIQTTARRIQPSLLEETVAELADMEAQTMQLLMGVISDMAKSCLKDYFRSAQKWLPLLTDLVNCFPKRPFAADEQRLVIDNAYEVIVHSYLTHLLQNSPLKLRRWNEEVGPAISTDAHRLHQTMETLAPGVQDRNQILLWVTEVLECGDTDGLKLTVALMKQDCAQHSVDLDLLQKMLQWKGLSKEEVKEVLDALPGAECGATPESWWMCLTCWVSPCSQ